MKSYQKTYVGVTDIMSLFHCSYSTAKDILKDAQKAQTKNYNIIEKRALLQKVLEVQGITDCSLWFKIQRDSLANG
jgi:hypothetical protein